MHGRTTVGAVLVVVVAATGYFTWRSFNVGREPARHAAPNGAVSAEIEQLRTEIDQLKQSRASDWLLAAQIAGRRDGTRVGDARPQERAGAVQGATSEGVESERERNREAEVKEAEHVEFLDRSFASEPRDAAWSNRARDDANRALGASLPNGSRIGEVECRSKLCRVETTHHNLEAFQAYNEGAFLGRDRKIWEGAVYSAVRSQSGNGITAVSYIAREGEAIPSAQAEPE